VKADIRERSYYSSLGESRAGLPRIQNKKRAANFFGLRRGCLSKSLAEFAARTPRNRSDPFFPRTCAGEKTLLSLQVCPKDARGRLQSPLSKKANGLF
jgi:hypothetical protein